MRNDPFMGEINIGDFSGIRKVMRAAKRGALPEETKLAIKLATTEKAKMRHRWYREQKAATEQITNQD